MYGSVPIIGIGSALCHGPPLLLSVRRGRNRSDLEQHSLSAEEKTLHVCIEVKIKLLVDLAQRRTHRKACIRKNNVDLTICFFTVSYKRSRSDRCATSPCTAVTFFPISPTALSNGFFRRPVINTWSIPSSTKRFAVENPHAARSSGNRRNLPCKFLGPGQLLVDGQRAYATPVPTVGSSALTNGTFTRCSLKNHV